MKNKLIVCLSVCLTLVILKLLNIIDLSWLIVFSPMIVLLVFLIILGLIGGFMFLYFFCKLYNPLMDLIKAYQKEQEEREKKIQDMVDMQDRVRRKVADDMFNGEN